MLGRVKHKLKMSPVWLLPTVGSMWMIAPAVAWAQTTAQSAIHKEYVDVKGYVTDEYNNPIAGATITTSTGKQYETNTDGYFEFKTPLGDKINVSFITMISQEVIVTNNKTLRIKLQSYDINIGEVVVTGYGQTTTRRTTGSVSVVDGKSLQDQPLFGVDKLLQGKVAGLNIKSVSGRPGQAAEVRIRGTNTITGNAEPLWVVDGVPLQKDIFTSEGWRFFGYILRWSIWNQPK